MEYLKVLIILVVVAQGLNALRKGMAKQKANAPGKTPRPAAASRPSGTPAKRPSRQGEARSLERIGKKATSLEKRPAIRDLEVEAMQNLHEHPFHHRLLEDTVTTERILEMETEKPATPVITDWRSAIIAATILERKEY